MAIKLLFGNCSALLYCRGRSELFELPGKVVICKSTAVQPVLNVRTTSILVEPKKISVKILRSVDL